MLLRVWGFWGGFGVWVILVALGVSGLFWDFVGFCGVWVLGVVCEFVVQRGFLELLA